MASLDKLKKKNQPQISVALLRIKPMSHDKAQMDAMSNTHGDMNMMDQKPTNNATPDTGEDTTEGGTHPAGTEPAPSNSLAGELQDLLNNVSAYYITAHQFHWNITGPDFAEFHKFFGKIYDDAFESLDGLAESIRKLDQMVDIEFGQPDECNGVDEMLNCLFDMNKALIDQYKNTIDCADKYREQGILNFLADRLDKHQMFQWQLTSFKA